MFWILAGAWPATDESKSETDDTALVEAAQRGSADAFAALHARYYRRIYRLAYLKTNNAADAEDVAGETFLRALSGLTRFRFPARRDIPNPSLYPWLHRIALNLIADSGRHRPPAGVVSLDAPVIAGMRALLGESLADVGDDPQAMLERQEVQQLVRGAIAALPADQGDVLIYRFLGELSAREIAAQMGRTEPAVKSLLHRAVVALRTEIERRVAAIERLESQRAQDPLEEAMTHARRSV